MDAIEFEERKKLLAARLFKAERSHDWAVLDSLRVAMKELLEEYLSGTSR